MIFYVIASDESKRSSCIIRAYYSGNLEVAGFMMYRTGNTISLRLYVSVTDGCFLW